MKSTYYSHGKLLLSAEYAVLDGALALALPLKSGQKMVVSQGNTPGLYWRARHLQGEWFNAHFDADLHLLKSTNPDIALNLRNILQHAISLAALPKTSLSGFDVQTTLEFNPDWGWGSSSTLINNLALWLKTDPYRLLWLTFGGSGYDIACASATGPLFYRLKTTQSPMVTPAPFSPPFIDRLWVVYLNRKQNSANAVSSYHKTKKVNPALLEEISLISRQMTQSVSVDNFMEQMSRHEALIKKITGLKTVKERLFPDFEGAIKSLGAWGGDFILCLSHQKKSDIVNFFQTKGYHTLFNLNEITLNR